MKKIYAVYVPFPERTVKAICTLCFKISCFFKSDMSLVFSEGRVTVNTQTYEVLEALNSEALFLTPLVLV